MPLVYHGLHRRATSVLSADYHKIKFALYFVHVRLAIASALAVIGWHTVTSQRSSSSREY